eukprot:scaffold4368_cov169-Isochrysis_galbana.AAC.1
MVAPETITRHSWSPTDRRSEGHTRGRQELHWQQMVHQENVGTPNPPLVSVAPRAAVAQCAVTSPRCVRRSLRRMAACSRRRASPVAIPGPVVAAVLRIAKKQCVGPLRVENTWIFERRLSICIKTNLS